MGQGGLNSIFGWMRPTGKNSAGLDDPWSSGGTDQSSYSGLDPKALDKWDTLFSGYTNPSGIAPWQQAGFDQAVRSAGTRFSAQNAAKGGYSPYTGAQIASSAVQYAAPQFATLNSQLLNQLMQQRQISTNTSKQRGPGYNYMDKTSESQQWWKMWGDIGSSWGSAGAGKSGGGAK